MKTSLALILALPVAAFAAAEPGGPDEPVRVEAPPIDLAVHDGRLRPAIGVESIQVLRANRTRPHTAENTGWTYNHAPMLAYWNDRFFLQYVSNPFSEALPPGQTLVTTSRDGRTWEMPTVVFPFYWLRSLSTGRPRLLMMHQRMGFYVAPNNRLLVVASYGYEPSIARVVRNANKDGTYGPIYVIRRTPGVQEELARYPFYTDSTDPEFVAACDALLADKLKTAQWREEEEDRDTTGFFRVPGPIRKAPSIYHRKDGTAVALFKEAWAAISKDEGKSWSTPVRVPTIVTDGAKSWGQRTEDGKYVMVYNPADFGSHRWPLATVTSDDGIVFSSMLLINGEVPPRRYFGGGKDFGMQYVRGISEGNGDPPGRELWLTYSSNKEDIWISRVPVPVRHRAEGPVSDTFDELEVGGKIPEWNVYRPSWAHVGIAAFPDPVNRSLRFEDPEPHDYAKAVRVFPESRLVRVTCRVFAAQTDTGRLEIDVTDGAGHRAVQLRFDERGVLSALSGETVLGETPYRTDHWYQLEISADATKGEYNLAVDGRSVVRRAGFTEPAASLERIEFRTGAYRTHPTRELDRYAGEDLPNADDATPPVIFYLDDVVIN